MSLKNSTLSGKKSNKKSKKDSIWNKIYKRFIEKGFTLIELLAVIIILGILMIIAIPSVTEYISNSRKKSYVATANQIVDGAKNLVNSGKLDFNNLDTTYFINASCINTEKENRSPYGEFTKAYVVVTYTGSGYNYYWTSVDETGQGVKNLTSINDLDEGDIVSGISSSEIEPNIAIGDRSQVALVNAQCALQEAQPATINVTENGKPINIKYPEGKTKATVVMGDIVKIGDEQFFVIKNEGGRVTLISRYNLNVGNNKKSDVPDLIQNEKVRGIVFVTGVARYGGMSFSSTNYWKGKIGTTYSGNYCTSISGANCASVYDENSILYSYIEKYKNYLIEQGAIIKEARLLTLEEAVRLGCGNEGRCYNAPSWLPKTSFWLATAYSDNYMWIINSASQIQYSSYTEITSHGIRPVIVI